MGNHMNTLEQIKRETRDDARLYACIRDLYDQGVSLSDLKALIPDIRRTREQLQLKRMLQNKFSWQCSVRRCPFFWMQKNAMKN